MNKFFQNSKDLREEDFYRDRVQNFHNAQKSKQRPYWLVKNTPHFRLGFQRENLIQLTDNCEWKAQK